MVNTLPIKFVVAGLGEAEGELLRHLAPRTVSAITNKLPLEGRAAIWKEEVYFEIAVKMGAEKAKATVKTGDICFWPIGSALCIFFGETQPYSPVNVVGRIIKNLELFSNVQSGTHIRVEEV